MGNKTVAVFGGSRVERHTPEYEEAYQMGKLLAGAGYTVVNGGYAGTMEASARGAKENGGRAIGVLSAEFGSLTPNTYLNETILHRDVFDRVREMENQADGFIVLKGSMGTLGELALVWYRAKVNVKHRKPIILVGNAWEMILNSWREHLAVTDDEASLLHIAKNPDAAIEFLNRALNSHPLPRSPSP